MELYLARDDLTESNELRGWTVGALRLFFSKPDEMIGNVGRRYWSFNCASYFDDRYKAFTYISRELFPEITVENSPVLFKGVFKANQPTQNIEEEG